MKNGSLGNPASDCCFSFPFFFHFSPSFHKSGIWCIKREVHSPPPFYPSSGNFFWRISLSSFLHNRWRDTLTPSHLERERQKIMSQHTRQKTNCLLINSKKDLSFKLDLSPLQERNLNWSCCCSSNGRRGKKALARFFSSKERPPLFSVVCLLQRRGLFLHTYKRQ